MPLDPHLQTLLGLLESMGRPSLSAGSPDAARQALRSVTVDVQLLNAKLPVGQVTDRTLPRTGGRGRLGLRIYRPVGRRAERRPTVVFFHGGGFVIGDLDTHDNTCRRLCRDLDAVVVSVAYRLAPEHPFPAGLDDCLAATRWAADNVGKLGGDRARLGVAGDSAGANLAAVVAQSWRDQDPTRPASLAAQLLIYPAVDLQDDDGERYPSRREHATLGFLTGDDLRWLGEHYATTVEDRRDRRLSPLHGDLAGLPPAVVATAEYDPLRDEGDAYAGALRAAGVVVEHLRFDGLLHGFVDLAPLSAACDEAVARMLAAARWLLAEPDRAAQR